MAEPVEDNPETLEARLARAEAKLRRLKIALWVVGIIALCALVPPLGAAVGLMIAVLAIVIAIGAYMYAVVWVVERLFGSRPDSNPTHQ